MKGAGLIAELKDAPGPTILRHFISLWRLYEAQLNLEREGWQKSLSGKVDFEIDRDFEVDRKEGKFSAPELFLWERSLQRTSLVLREATCIHRALALHRILKDRSIPARIVVGLRRGTSGQSRSGALEGHAWIEVKTPDSLLRAFLSDSGGYSEIKDLKIGATYLDTKRKKGP